MDADLTTGPDVSPAGGPPEPEAPEPAPSGRNLPVAAGIGVLLGGLVVATLFTVKATFLIFMAVAIGVGCGNWPGPSGPAASTCRWSPSSRRRRHVAVRILVDRPRGAGRPWSWAWWSSWPGG